MSDFRAVAFTPRTAAPSRSAQWLLDAAVAVVLLAGCTAAAPIASAEEQVRREPSAGAMFCGSPYNVDDVAIPPPLTIEQVSAMTKDEALARLIEVAKATQKARKTQDTALYERLKREQQWLLDHRQTMNGSGVSRAPVAPQPDDHVGAELDVEAPAPLTVADVDAMSRDDALDHLCTLVAARRQAQALDDAQLVDRLQHDERLLLDRCRWGDEERVVRFDAPSPLTAEQVKAMTKDEALDHLIKVAKASKSARTLDDTALIERLKQERQWLIDRRKEADP